MKVAQISKPAGGFELVEREIPQPGAGQVRVKVETCGICHSDVFVMIEKYPLSEVSAAYQQMHSGKARFRVVLTMGD